ncbi:MAG TPA: DUF4157 domain-containing protein [Dehalococcoidia bacterium]|nr:DUF4157 domain-containing protein [Dehalococcoidia bacterium]
MKKLLYGVAAVVAYFVYILPAVTLLNLRRPREPLTDATRVVMLMFFPQLDLTRVMVIDEATLPWPRPRRAITLGRTIYVRNSFDQATSRDRRLLLHELVHVDQYRRMGTAGFIWAYGRALAEAGSYRKNALEVEAFVFVMNHRGSIGHL